MSKAVYTDMTKSEFNGKIGTELWKFAARCRDKAKKLWFIKTRNGFRLYIKSESGWHKFFIGSNYIRIVRNKFRYFSDRGLIYYRWEPWDDHADVIDYFAYDLKGYFKAMFPSKNSDPRYFNYHLQSYAIQKYLEQIAD